MFIFNVLEISPSTSFALLGGWAEPRVIPSLSKTRSSITLDEDLSWHSQMECLCGHNYFALSVLHEQQRSCESTIPELPQQSRRQSCPEVLPAR